MSWFDERPSFQCGGRAKGGGGGVSFYHLSFRSGSRGGGACAGAAHAYITRTEQYHDPDRDVLVHTESDHMPSWAQDDPHEYWDAADVFERANGRLYLSADFALPRDLERGDQIELAHAFAQELTANERLPYTLAIHEAETLMVASTTHTRISWSRSAATTASSGVVNSGFDARTPNTRSVPARQRAGRFMGTTGWSAHAAAGRTSRMRRSNAAGARSGSITAATSGRESIGSQANTSARAPRTRSLEGKATTAWKPLRRLPISRRRSGPSRTKSRGWR
jgi:MobA/MobL family